MIGAANQVGVPQRQANEVQRVLAPTKGVDTRTSVTLGDPFHCIYAYNLIPYEFGMRVRNGYREWQVGIEDTAGAGVRTVIPYDGVPEDGNSDRLFAVTNEGIWDVTGLGGTPVLKIAFTDTGEDAGYGVYSHYVNDAEEDLLYYADSKNGLFVYTASTEVWAQATDITGGVDVTKVNFVMVHKQRIWLVEQDSTKGWYLPVGSQTGAATPFFFGSKFRHGGNLVGLFNWTIDGGEGVDDYFVAVSRAGDILPFKGSDPSTDQTWELVGTYFVGQIPKGGTFATEHGGELFILSSYGLASMNDLLNGVDTRVSSAALDSNSPSAKIAAVVREALRNTLDVFGWQVRVIPDSGSLLIAGPKDSGELYIQFNYNLAVSAWGFWRDLPIICFDTFKNRVFFGDADNRICAMDVFSDDVKLNAIPGDVIGKPVLFSLLSSFQAYGSPGIAKKVSNIRGDFIAETQPTVNYTVRYDYDFREGSYPSATPSAPVSIWDVALWDQSVWSSNTGLISKEVFRGAWGMGRYVAIAMQGKSVSETRFIGWDVIFESGGMLA